MISSKSLSLAAISVFVFASVCLPQTDQRLLSKIVFIRSPDTDKDCTDNNRTMAVSVGNDSVSIRAGDDFQIITHANGILSARVMDKCKPSFWFSKGLFLFRAEDYIDWSGEFDALLAVKGNALESNQAGSIARIHPNAVHRASILKALKGRISPNDTVRAEHAMIVSPPNSTRLFLFVPAEHYDRKYESVPDDAIVTEGLLFELQGSQISLVISETGFLDVYTISDLDNDGVWEMLVQVQADTWASGRYELRYLEGDHFRKERIDLYDWSH